MDHSVANHAIPIIQRLQSVNDGAVTPVQQPASERMPSTEDFFNTHQEERAEQETDVGAMVQEFRFLTNPEVRSATVSLSYLSSLAQ
jgi:hypothetical protein